MTHPQRFALERYSAGERADSDITSHVRACETCSAYVTALEKNRAAMVESLPPFKFAAKIEVRAQKRRRRQWWSFGVLAVATAAVAFAVFPERDAYRAKGTESIVVYRLRKGAVQRLKNDDRILAGDALRLEFPPRVRAAWFVDASGHRDDVDVSQERSYVVDAPCRDLRLFISTQAKDSALARTLQCE